MRFAALALAALLATTGAASARCGGAHGYCHYRYYSQAPIGEWSRAELEQRYNDNDTELTALRAEKYDRANRLPLWIILAALSGLAVGIGGTLFIVREGRL